MFSCSSAVTQLRATAWKIFFLSSTDFAKNHICFLEQFILESGLNLPDSFDFKCQERDKLGAKEREQQ